MPNFNSEMAAVPVGQLFTATMDALVQGQYAASLKSLELFQQIAYDSTGDLQTMPFTFERINQSYDPASSTEQPTIKTTVDIPTAALINYPNMSIDYADWEFNVDLSSHEYQQEKASTSASAAVNFRAKLGWWGNLNISGKVASQKSTVSGVDVKRRYGMPVKAHIVRESPPPALEKIFDLMLEGMTAKAG